MKIISELRARRVSKKIPLERLSLISGYSRGRIGAWERGENAPTLPALIAWVESLGGEIKIEWTSEPKD